MSISLVGTNYAENVGAGDPYNGAALVTWLSWIQISDLTQNNRGIFCWDEAHDGFNLRQMSHQIAGGAGRWRAACNATATPGNNTLWTKNVALTVGLHSLISVYDGTQPAGAANRFRQYLDGVDDGANGVYAGTAPGVVLITASGAVVFDVGSMFLDPFGTTRGDFIGCCCMNAGWLAQAASAADVLAIHLLGASGDLTLSPLGQPRNWYRFQSNLLDSGTIPLNMTQQGAPAITFGCPGGDPSCGGGSVPVPIDLDFSMRIRRRR